MSSSVYVVTSPLVRRQGNSNFILSGDVDFLLIIAWDHLWAHTFSQLKDIILLFFLIYKYTILTKFFIFYKI
jgi:hypothetical protein